MANVLMQERRSVSPTGVERHLGREEVIVSKTDPKGLITYANPVFCRLAGYTMDELLGAPHNIIRHPDMPRCVFKFLWDTIAEGKEVFAYVKNMARNGDHYWVLAHVTPSYGPKGEIVGYHSNRRCPDPRALAAVEPLYQQLRRIETGSNPREALDRSMEALVSTLNQQGMSYDKFIFTIINRFA